MQRIIGAQGRDLNGKYGVVRGSSKNGGLLSLEIFAADERHGIVIADCSAPISLRPCNLDVFDGESGDYFGYRLLEMYLLKKSIGIMPSEGRGELMYETIAEVFALPGFVPMQHDKVLMVALLRCCAVGEYGQV